MTEKIHTSPDRPGTVSAATERKLIITCAIVASALAVIDQWTKFLVVRSFRLYEQVPVIPGFFNMTYVTNKGAAWGMFAGYGWLLLIISITVMTVILFRLRKLAEGWAERYCALFLVLSGIVGNSIDRMWRKEVVDFLDFRLGSYSWPAFNVADSAITVGVIIYIISLFLRPAAAETETAAKDS